MAIEGNFTNDMRVVVTWGDDDDPDAAPDVAARVAAENGHRLTDTTVATTRSISWVTEPEGPSA